MKMNVLASPTRRQGRRQDALVKSEQPLKHESSVTHSVTRGATTFKASDVLCAAHTTNISFHYTVALTKYHLVHITTTPTPTTPRMIA